MVTRASYQKNEAGQPPGARQQRLFAHLARRFAKRSDMVSAVGQTLHLGRDAVYRRLRGDTVLTIDELYTLADHYNLPLRGGSSSGLSYPTEQLYVRSEVEYYRNFCDRCRFFTDQSGMYLDYATAELPFYFEFGTPALLLFKTYIYGITTWDFDKWRDRPFTPAMVDPAVGELAREVLDVMFDVPGRELWSVRILDTTLRQLEYTVETGRLQQLAVVEEIYAELRATVDHVAAMSRSGKRFQPGSQPTKESPDFRAYHHALTNTNNVIIVRTPARRYVYSMFVTPTYLMSSDEQMSHYLTGWFDRMIATADPLQEASQGSAERFFARLHYIINQSLDRVWQVMKPTNVRLN